MQIRTIFFIEIWIYSQKLTLMRTSGVYFFSCSLCISILDYKSHPVPVPASLFLSIAVCQREDHCQQPNTDGQSQSNLPANAPEMGNGSAHYF